MLLFSSSDLICLVYRITKMTNYKLLNWVKNENIIEIEATGFAIADVHVD